MIEMITVGSNLSAHFKRNENKSIVSSINAFRVYVFISHVIRYVTLQLILI